MNLLLKNVSGQVADINATTDFSTNKVAGAGESALHYAAKGGDEVRESTFTRSLSYTSVHLDLPPTPKVWRGGLFLSIVAGLLPAADRRRGRLEHPL